MLNKVQIYNALENGDIKITPFHERFLTNNSYDVHLDNKLLVYTEFPLDVSKENPVKEIFIPKEGYIMMPDILYLGSIIETIDNGQYVPYLDGSSSKARLGLTPHLDTGWGDIGFHGKWTLEIVVVHPLRIFAGVKIGKMLFDECDGPDSYLPIFMRDKSRYHDNSGVEASKGHEDFFNSILYKEEEI